LFKHKIKISKLLKPKTYGLFEIFKNASIITLTGTGIYLGCLWAIFDF